MDSGGPKQLPWHLAISYASFWLFLYLVASVTFINYVPKPLTIEDEEMFAGNSFIAERAYKILVGLDSIGPKVPGSVANDVTAVEFLKAEIEKVRAQMSDFFELEVNVQVASGNYVFKHAIHVHQAIQNVVTKLSAKGSDSDSYLLINSHFDTVATGPGAGDSGSMISVMLEVMRVLAKSEGPLKHPIVFLFNGAEEHGLQAAYAFLTQHEWAKNCKALINLDSAGSGGREILFRFNAKHSWIMYYYRIVPHPFGSSLGHEIFEANLISSDTDFRVFRDFGGMTGLDMAYIFNGYVYHTEYDSVSIFPEGSLQSTGDNVLSLAKSLANAPEMDAMPNEEDSVVFYDFLGLFMIMYSRTIGIVINVVVCVLALIAIGVSIYFMSVHSGVKWTGIMRCSAIILAIHIASFVAAAGLTLIVALFMDGVGCSMTWFSQTWLVIGLYFCPMFFGMGIFPAFYLETSKSDVLSIGLKIQLLMHAHCFCLIILTIALTIVGLCSAYMSMMAVMFDTLALSINLITKWHDMAYRFAIMVTVCQILPFLYYTFMAQLLYKAMIPRVAYTDPGKKPDLLIASIAILMSIFIAGFIMPVFMLFRKSRMFITCFFGVTLLFIIIAVNPVGFPFTAKTATKRLSTMHIHRVIHSASNMEPTDGTGIYVFLYDRRVDTVEEYIEAYDEKHEAPEFCGLPYSKLYVNSFTRWIPMDERPNIPDKYPELNLTSVNNLNDSGEMIRKRYNFLLSGPPQKTICISPVSDTKIINWSFDKSLLASYSRLYFIYFIYGKDDTPLQFYIEIEKPVLYEKLEAFQIEVSGFWMPLVKNRTSKYEEIFSIFPNYISVDNWLGTYESWFF